MDVVRRITSYYSSKYDDQLELVISNSYALKVSSFTQEQLDNPKLQTALTMASREMYSVKNATNVLQNIISSFVAYILAVVVVWHYAWGIGLLLFLLVPVLAVSNYFQTKRRRQSWEDSSVNWRIANGLFDYITDPLRLFQVRIMGARENVLKLREYHLKKEMKIRQTAELKNIYLQLAEDIISPLIEVGTRVWAILLVATARLSFDQFLFVIGLIQQASSQTFMLGYSITNAQETYLATNALREVMEMPEMPNGTKQIDTSLPGIAIKLDHVSLKYQNKTVALNDISLDIKAGQKVAIVGENGAGKTSLLRLITRQYEPTSGEIYIDNVKIGDIDNNSLYDNMSVLSQDYFLFNQLTIKENLSVASSDKMTDREVYSALRTVHLYDKVASLKGKLRTRLDKSFDDGADLSGGQSQRLSIARTLLKPFKLLVLDEPTSAIDAKAERNIFNSIMERAVDATVIIVSHRFSTVRKADYIYVVDGGKIIEQGSHNSLLAKNGHYAELYRLQVEDYT